MGVVHVPVLHHRGAVLGALRHRLMLRCESILPQLRAYAGLHELGLLLLLILTNAIAQ